MVAGVIWKGINSKQATQAKTSDLQTQEDTQAKPRVPDTKNNKLQSETQTGHLKRCTDDTVSTVRIEIVARSFASSEVMPCLHEEIACAS